MELHQSGTDILKPPGLTIEEVTQAADKRQDLTVPLPRLHAVLDQQQFDATAQIMRESPHSPSAAEAQTHKSHLAEADS